MVKHSFCLNLVKNEHVREQKQEAHMQEVITFLENHEMKKSELEEEVKVGLLSEVASIPSKFFYDLLGSKLFEAITLLPEYYLTRKEAEILNTHLSDIALEIGKHMTLIDLGAGSCQKAASLFESLEPKTYIAVDISVDFLKEILPKLQAQYPAIEMIGVGVDFSTKLDLPPSVDKNKRVFFYPGSSLGNFNDKQAATLLKQVHDEAQGGGLLLGLDLWKDEGLLKSAYDDPLKMTAAFNLNVLHNVNALIGSDFLIEDFCHHIEINPILQRVEMYLQTQKDVTVSWPNQKRDFKKGERIHTENSHKYSIDKIKHLLTDAGFQQLKIWTDPNHYYAVIYAHSNNRFD
jgi:L-histidine N-alpha-methyltransferase